MIKNNLFLVFCILFTIFHSCDDVFEEDITSDPIVAIAPLEGHTNEGSSVQFSWNAVDGADSYKIQVLHKNNLVAVDSIITTTTFKYNLVPGDYEWKVKGTNFAYETAYTPVQSFKVVLSENLAMQELLLNTPSNNLYTNRSVIIFTWSSLTPSETYDFVLIQDLNGQQQTISQQTGITATSLEVGAALFNADARYIWRVKAVNAISETPFSERALLRDTRAPNQPVLVAPSHQQTVSSEVNFNWSNGADVGPIQSPITTAIEIATDTNFQSIVTEENTSESSYQYTFSTTGTYYWRTRAKDTATNISTYSTVSQIIVE